MSDFEDKRKNRLKRKKRIRKKISGTAERPRMSIYRSLRHCYVQLIDDAQGTTLLGVSTLSPQLRGSISKSGNIEAAKKLGALVAQKALEMSIKRVVFDRNGYLYHGQVKALSESARENGLQF